MKKVKVLHITQAFGGVQTYILNIVTASNKKNIEHAVLCPTSTLSAEIQKIGITHFSVNMKRSPGVSDIIYLFKIIVIIFKYKPTVLHVHSAKGGALGRLAGFFTRTKIIFTPNAFSFLGFSGKQRVVYKFIEKLLRPFTNILLAVSKSEGDRAINELGYKKGRVCIIPNSIFIEINKKVRDYSNCNRVGMIGRLILQKNPQLFIEIATAVHAKRPDVKFILLGEGYLDFLKEQVYKLIELNQAHDFIEILKWGNYSIEKFYNEVDIFLLTSKFEGLPFSLLEAMKYGIPVIATNVDGNKDVINDNVDGFLINEHNLSECVGRVIELIDDIEIREKIGLAGNKKVMNNFNINKNIVELEELYLKFCN